MESQEREKFVFEYSLQVILNRKPTREEMLAERMAKFLFIASRNQVKKSEQKIADIANRQGIS